MQAGAEPHRQIEIAGDQQRQASHPAGARQGLGQCHPIRRTVVAQHHQHSGRQPVEQRSRIGQPVAVGHQREAAASPAFRAAPIEAIRPLC